jgi:hypothetical protein
VGDVILVCDGDGLFDEEGEESKGLLGQRRRRDGREGPGFVKGAGQLCGELVSLSTPASVHGRHAAEGARCHFITRPGVGQIEQVSLSDYENVCGQMAQSLYIYLYIHML